MNEDTINKEFEELFLETEEKKEVLRNFILKAITNKVPKEYQDFGISLAEEHDPHQFLFELVVLAMQKESIKYVIE